MTMVLPSLDPQEWAEAIERPLDTWHGSCHSVSIACIRAGLVENARIARGMAIRITSQHSWISLGNPYDHNTVYVDPTWWAWWQPNEPMIWVGNRKSGLHRPHGAGSIWAWGKPVSTGGKPITLDGLSAEAQGFMDMLGPLDRVGWSRLLTAPVEGWPAAEIIGKAYDDDRLSPWIPIDIVGMLTDHNPDGLYQ